MFPRPFTGSLSPAKVALVALYAPIHAADHLVQAWEAIREALHTSDDAKEAANLTFARTRLACARSEPVARAVKARDRKAYEAECASLDAALRDYV